MVISVYNAFISDKLIKWDFSVSILVKVPKAENDTKGTESPHILNQRTGPLNQDLLKGCDTNLDNLSHLSPLVSISRGGWSVVRMLWQEFVHFCRIFPPPSSETGFKEPWEFGMCPPQGLAWNGRAKRKKAALGSSCISTLATQGYMSFPKAMWSLGEGWPSVILEGTLKVFQPRQDNLNREKNNLEYVYIMSLCCTPQTNTTL